MRPNLMGKLMGKTNTLINRTIDNLRKIIAPWGNLYFFLFTIELINYSLTYS